MQIVVPCKQFDLGKSRLATCLSPPARRSLCEELLRGTLALALNLAEPANIFVVTSDPDASRIAQMNSTRVVFDRGNGLNASLNDARQTVLQSYPIAETLLIMPTDLPFLRADVIKNACDVPAHITIAPDQSGTGTNLLILRGAAVEEMRFSFGKDSFAAHINQARKLGFSTHTFYDWRAALDIDGPSQFSEWVSHEEPKRGQDDRISRNAVVQFH